MFIGIQIIKEQEHKALLAETREEIENAPCMVFDRIDEVEWAEMYNGVIYTDSTELQAVKETAVKAVRDELLVTEFDPVYLNKLRWDDMSESVQQVYLDYRKYLLDYTKTLAWYEKNPLTFEEWKKEQENGTGH